MKQGMSGARYKRYDAQRISIQSVKRVQILEWSSKSYHGTMHMLAELLPSCHHRLRYPRQGRSGQRHDHRKKLR